MLDSLDLFLIAPIRWALLEVLQFAYSLTHSHGLALIVLSVVFNLLLMPAYHWAEKVQARERAIQQRMRSKIDEFRAVFKGQELHMMLRQLYQLHGYHPAYALRALAPLAIQIPFFIAAFGLLSDYAPFNGASFLFIDDLARPDGLLAGANLLPLVMTAVNLLALELYARQLTSGQWAQGVGVALIFLVLLYASPSGLVLYWTFNNVLSLAKSAWYARDGIGGVPQRSHLMRLMGDLLGVWRSGRTQRLLDSLSGTIGRTYWLACACLFMLVIVALPIGFASLEDNVDGLSGYIPFVLSAALLSSIPALLLCTIAYRLFSPAWRAWTSVLAFCVTTLALVFAFVQQPDAGMLDNFVFFTPQALAPGAGSLALDLFLTGAVIMFSLWLAVRHPNALRNVLGVLLLTSVLSIGASLWSLDKRIDQTLAVAAPDTTLFRYSRTEPNVLLIFLDGAMSGYIPAILEDEPQLKTQLLGFSWYPNVISSGNRTINGLPSVFGGPDYTVGAINARQDGSLKEKVSDAYRLYVENFHAQGYDVQYSDPFWFGLVRSGDCDLFNQQYAKTGKGRCIHSIGQGVQERKRKVTSEQSSDFFQGLTKQYLAITLFRIAPHSLKNAIYDGGQWLSMSFAWKKRLDKYLNNFFSLHALPQVSSLDSDRPTFNFITNETPRAPFLLDDDCLPTDARDGKVSRVAPRFKDAETQKIFETHRCVLLGVGEFVSWMREQGVLDNTYIVLASDHGWVSDNPLLDGIPGQRKYAMYQAFLMVKPFNADHTLREDPTYIANFNVPGMLCETIGGCLDRATGKTIRYTPLVPPVTLYETPWQPAGQTHDKYVIDAVHENRGPVSQALSWHTANGTDLAELPRHDHAHPPATRMVTSGAP